MFAGVTPSQTIGPFFAVLRPLAGSELVEPGAPGALQIDGRVLDGEGMPVPDAMLEVWQANRAGRYAHPEDTQEALLEEGFTGFGRCFTDSSGAYHILSVRPGSAPGSDGRVHAPHINISIFARGLLQRLVTRMYFPDEPAANANDPVLASIADPATRSTLIATDEGDGAFRFDIRLQGPGETAFFAV